MPSVYQKPIEEMLDARWRKGQREYRPNGGEFAGDPIEDMYEEMLDAVNYAREARRQGTHKIMAGVVEVEVMDLLNKIREVMNVA